MERDTRGYYAMLGVAPEASEKLIKAAYRLMAQELHPDVNSAPDAKEQFQKLQEAYRVLSDPAERRAYDASHAAEPVKKQASSGQSAGPQATATNEASAGWEAVTCHRCSAISALPRYREYQTVKSFLVTSVHTTERGVYCASCDTRKALLATGVTASLGWWSIQGMLSSPFALWHNLTAGMRFRDKTARLLALQAGYFASRGKPDLARAIADEALRSMPKLRTTFQQRRRAKLGYAIEDPLEDVKAFVRSVIASATGVPSQVALRHEPPLANRRVAYQALMLLPIAGLVVFITTSVIQEESAAQARRADAETQRLQRQGLEAAQAQAIARQQREALDAMRQPLPLSGLLHYDQPQYRYMVATGTQLPELKVHASSDRNYLIKLEDVGTGAAALTMFVRAGGFATVSVPFGTYRIKTASGTDWFGETVRFGPDTAYYAMDSLATFSQQGDMLEGHEIELTPVRDGNLRKSGIAPDQF